MKRGLFFAFLLAFVLASATQAVAYQLSGVMLQHRAQEVTTDPKNPAVKVFNRIQADIQDDFGQPVTDASLLTSMRLIGPDGNGIAIGEPVCEYAYGKTGWYDMNVGQWIYPSAFYYAFTAKANFTAPLVKGGRYRLVMVYGGQTLSMEVVYPGAVNLPCVASRSINSSKTKAGDLILRWLAPRELFLLTKNKPALSTSARAAIDVYKGSEYIGYVQIKVGTHMEEAFFSKAFLDEARSMGGDNYKAMIVVRVNDNSNRSYSATMPITLP